MTTARFGSLRPLLIAGFAFAVSLGGVPPPSFADDSDIFRFRATPNVLVIVDDSGSMARTYGGTEVGDLDGQTRAAFGGTGTQTSSRVDVAYRVLYQLLNGNGSVPSGLTSSFPTQRSHVSPDGSGTDGLKYNQNLTSADEDAVKLRLGLMIYGPNITWPSSGSPTFQYIRVPVQINGTDNNLPPFNTSYSSFWSAIKNNLTPGNNPTPMARSLEAARRRYFPIAAASDNSTACRMKFVVLITDGEDTIAASGSGNVPKYYGPGGSQPDATTDTNYGILANFNANGYPGSTNTGQKARNTESISQAKLLADDNVILLVVGIGMKRDSAGNDVPHLKVLRQVVRRMAEQKNIDLSAAEYTYVAQNGDNTAIGAGKTFFAEDATELLAALQQVFDTIIIQAYSFTAPVVPAVRTTDSNRLYLSTFRPDNPPETYWEGACKSINLNVDGSIPADLDAATNWYAGSKLNSTNRNYSTNPRKVYTASVSGTTWSRQEFSNSNGWLDNNILAVPSAVKASLVDNVVLRASSTKRLGDIFHSTPVVVGAPSLFFTAPGFSTNVGSGTSFLQDKIHRQRVIYAGSNDGMLHAFNAGIWDTTLSPPAYNAGGVGGGNELFGYIPNNLLPSLKNMTVTTTSTHQYMVDSSPKAADVWLDADNDGLQETLEWKTVIITGERKGGRGLFALDITSPENLDSVSDPYPVPLWEITNATVPNFGQTWSEPFIGRVKIREGTDVKDRWVAFVGGGDWHNTTLSANAAAGATSISVVDSTGFPSSGTGILSIGTEGGINFGSSSTTSITGIPSSGTGRITRAHTAGEVVSSSGIARGFYVVDIKLGKVIWSLEASSASDNAVAYPMTSGPVGVDSDNDGFLNFVYIVDLGGQLWRFNVGTPATFDNVSNLITGTEWSGVRYFAASPSTTPTVQRSFHRVEVAFDAGFNRWIFFGTGDREKPENTGTGRIYAIRDDGTVPSTPYSESNLSNFTSVIANVDSTVTGTVTPTQKGWYAVMPNTNEKVLSDPVLFNDVLFFSAFRSETTNLCMGGGEARLYGIRASLSASTGTSDMSAGAGGLIPASGTTRVRSRLLDSGGIPSSPVVSMSASGGASLYIGTTNAARVQSFAIDSPAAFKRLRRWKEFISQ